jgi:cysteine desulfurase
MLCLSGHKFNGPKGIGALYVKKGIKLTPLIHGGGQESGLRGGTYNTPLIVGMGEAARIAKIDFDKNVQSILAKRNEIETYLLENNIATINFQNQKTAPHIISASLINKDAEDFILEHAHEFAVSTGSACNSGINTGSHVLNELSIDKQTIRISI